jgi:hypothetical protein
MSCQSCAHWTKGPMSQYGLQACAHGKSYTYLPGNATCDRLERLSPDKLAKRMAWLKERGLAC